MEDICGDVTCHPRAGGAFIGGMMENCGPHKGLPNRMGRGPAVPDLLKRTTGGPGELPAGLPPVSCEADGVHSGPGGDKRKLQACAITVWLTEGGVSGKPSWKQTTTPTRAYNTSRS